MPSATRTQWDPTKDFRFKNRTAEDFELARLVFKKQLEMVGPMRRAGVEFLAGTDVLNPYCFPGFSLHDELVLLDANPLEDIHNTQKINAVMVRGKLILRAELQRMLVSIEAVANRK